MLRLGTLAQEGEMVQESPRDKDVRKTIERSPSRAQPNDEQNGANEIRNKRDQERGMRSDSDGIGKMCHEVRPMCRLLLPAVPQKKRGTRPHSQDCKASRCSFGNKPHRENVLYASHQISPCKDDISRNLNEKKLREDLEASAREMVGIQIRAYEKSYSFRMADVCTVALTTLCGAAYSRESFELVSLKRQRCPKILALQSPTKVPFPRSCPYATLSLE